MPNPTVVSAALALSGLALLLSGCQQKNGHDVVQIASVDGMKTDMPFDALRRSGVRFSGFGSMDFGIYVHRVDAAKGLEALKADSRQKRYTIELYVPPLEVDQKEVSAEW